MEGEKTTALHYEQAEVLIVAIMRFMVLGRQNTNTSSYWQLKCD